MRVSYRWLKELLPWLEASPSEVGARLTSGGLELEGLVAVGTGLDPVEVVTVTAIEPHPKKSGLRLVTVDRGSSTQRVVCGAPNVPAPGGQVLLAPLGTHLPALGVTLGAREIAGVLSEGMLCSEKELGLGESGEGILVLPPESFSPGSKLCEVLPAQDTILELGVTPNRPDALGHVGIARELAALYEKKFELPTPGEPTRFADAAIGELVSVEVGDGERCPYYGAMAVLGVQTAPSPPWLRWRLAALGVRPINNVVDLTNLVLLEWGQPLHAFDLAKLRDRRVVVRRATSGERLTTLDARTLELDVDDLVIADGESATALAGVMGGKDSEITDATHDVLLECAWFSPRGVRRSARRHGLHTESSHRFERGVDWGATPQVLRRAQTLLVELAGGAATRDAVERVGALPELPVIKLRAARIDRLLGVEVPFEEACVALRRLGFAPLGIGEPVVEVRGASHRPDVTREADLIEEIARLRGLDAIPTVLPPIVPQEPGTAERWARRAREAGRELGLSEAVTYAFVSPRELEVLGAPAPVVRLAHPLTEERSVMRTSVLPGLLEALRRSRRQGERALRIFTVGATFTAPPKEAAPLAIQRSRPRRASDAGILPEERLWFGALLAGPRPTWLTAPEEHDVWDAKGLAEALIARLTHREAVLRAAPAPHLHPRGAATVLVDDVAVGRLGPLHPDVVEGLDLDGTAQVLELDLDALEALGRAAPRFEPFARLPAVTRDLALTVSEDVGVAEIEALLAAEAGELCESVQLFDVFRGGAIPEGQRSLAFRLVYRDPQARRGAPDARTLTDHEVDERHAAVVRAASERVGAELRA